MSMRTAQGPMDVDVEMITRFPDSTRRVIKTPMGEMTVVITSDSAFMAGPMGTRDLPDSQRQSMRTESKQDLINVLKNLDNPAYKFNIVGTEKVGDINAQILEVNADGTTFRWDVDPATGRVLRRISQGQMGEQITEFTEWKKVGDINLPVGFTMTAGGQQAGGGKLTTVEVNPTVDAAWFQKPVAK